MNSGDSPRRESKAKNGTWCAATIRQIASRASNGTPARQSIARTSIAPRREWPGWLTSPLAGSITVVSGLQMSCSSAARNRTSRRAASACWNHAESSSASSTMRVWMPTLPSA